MLQPDLASQVRLLADALRLPEALPGERVSAVSRLEAGKPVSARIQEQLPDGRYRVHIAGRDLALQLPGPARPGQEIRLMYLGPEPQLNFSLLPSTENASTRVSSAGQLLSSLTLHPPAADNPTSIRPAVLNVLPMACGEIIARLRQTLTQSGLFYESHQARWVAGEHPLEQLLREPQGRLPPAAPNGAAGAPASSPAHPDTLPILQQQLAALETGQILWQGQIWPGQSMEWRIGEHADGNPAMEGETIWETRLNLDMVALGPIEARLRLARGGFSIDLRAVDEGAAKQMQEHRGALAHSMEAAGLAVSAIRVSSDARA